MKGVVYTLMDIDNGFIKLSNNLVWNYEDGREKTLAYQYGEGICHIYSYLNCMENRFGTTTFSLENMISSCGLKVKSGLGNVNNQFRDILVNLVAKGIITNCSMDIDKIKPNDFVACEFKMEFIKDKDKLDTEFFTITRDNYLKIINSTDTKLSKLTMLKVYYYLTSRIYKTKSHSDKASTFYDEYDTICYQLDIATNTFNTYITELQKLELIYFKNIGMIIKNGNPKMANNVYCKCETDLGQALIQSRNFYENRGWKILSAKANSTQNQIKGLKGQIKKQQNQGKDTSILEKKVAKLQSKIENKVVKSKADIFKDIEDKYDYMVMMGYEDEYASLDSYFESNNANLYSSSEEELNNVLNELNEEIMEYRKIEDLL